MSYPRKYTYYYLRIVLHNSYVTYVYQNAAPECSSHCMLEEFHIHMHTNELHIPPYPPCIIEIGNEIIVPGLSFVLISVGDMAWKRQGERQGELRPHQGGRGRGGGMHVHLMGVSRGGARAT